MDLKAFVLDLFESIKQWVEPELETLKSRILGAEQTIDERVKTLTEALDTLKTGIKTEIKSAIDASIEHMEKQHDERFNAIYDKDLLELSKTQNDKIESLETLVNELKGEIELLREGIKEPHSIDEIKAALDIDSVLETANREQLKQLADDFIAERINPILKGLETISLPKDGKDGLPGKDALQLEILPSIDFEKNYPRGTYAMHQGGLIRAYQQTVGEKGWETLLNGLASLHLKQVNERSFVVIAHQTNGETIEMAFDMPVMIYREVWQPNTEYKKGDCVTWNGSVWHCNETTTTKPNTVESDQTKSWTLAVKQGRPGKASVKVDA